MPEAGTMTVHRRRREIECESSSSEPVMSGCSRQRPSRARKRRGWDRRSQEKVARLAQGVSPFYEPGLSELIREGAAAGGSVSTASPPTP